jgi:hypothetical protein
MKPLTELGMAEALDTYPASFRANLSPNAMDWYLRVAAQSFRQDFGTQSPQQRSDSTLPSMTFIKDRQSLLRMDEQETRNATKTINYIVSGHRVPDSTVLAYRKASTVGVGMRAIIQNTAETTNNSLENYRDMGVEVRYLPNIGIRLFVFDGRTAILTSYDETQSSRAFGIRFTHESVAQQLDQLFEQRWLEAEPLE